MSSDQKYFCIYKRFIFYSAWLCRKKYHISDFLIEFLPLRAKKRNFQAHREGDHAASSILPEMSRNQAELAQGTILSDYSGINNRYGTVREHQD